MLQGPGSGNWSRDGFAVNYCFSDILSPFSLTWILYVL